MNSSKARELADEAAADERRNRVVDQGMLRMNDPEDLWTMEIPVLDAHHIKQDSFAWLINAVLNGKHAGAVGPEQVYVYVPEVFREANVHGEDGQFTPDLCELFKWAQRRGCFEYVRLDHAIGTAVPDLKTHEWEQDHG